MGFYTFEEFQTGFKALNCGSVEEMKKKMSQLSKEYEDPNIFRDLYNYVFDFAKDQGVKNLPVDTAVGFWELLLSKKCKYLKEWIEFITVERKDLQVITKDTW